jgi:benzoyl-CoA reductase subunit D
MIMEDKDIYTIGIDVGGSYIKAVLMSYSDSPSILASKTEKVRKRNPMLLSEEIINYLLAKQEMKYSDISYVASTGEGEMVKRKTGHFYSMTTHSRGAKYFYSDCKTVVDMGALYVRAIKVNGEGRVMDYKMTGQCASGSGQFIENISRYLGLSIEEVGEISLTSYAPETPSGICAVLAETDVINMVSRGISTPDIIKGIHLSVAGRIVKLMSSLKSESPVFLTGGMALNTGMVQAVRELVKESNYNWELVTHPMASYAGAVGAALWGGYRFRKLKNKEIFFAQT